METSGVMGHSKQVEGYEHGLFTASEIASSQKTEYRPTTNSASLVEFDIKALPGKIYDVKSMTLFFKMGIRKKVNGEWIKITANDTKNIGLCNNTPQAVWSNASIKVVDTEIGDSTGNTYPFLSYLQTLLSARKGVEKTLLERRNFIKDEPMEWESLNDGTKNRARAASFTKEWLPFIIPLHNDLQTIEGHFLPPNTKMTVTLKRSPDEFVLMKTGDIEYKIVLDDIHLKMFTMTPTPTALNRFYTRFRNKPPKLSYTQNVLKTYTVPSGNLDLSCHNLFFGDNLPDQVFVVMVDQKAFNGTTTKDPFKFQHFDLTSANLVVNSVSEPSTPYAFDVTYNNIEMYYELLENTGTAPFEMDSIDISPLEFRSGYFIMAWDRNPVKNNRVAPVKMDGGYMSIKLKTKTALTNNITVLVYGSYVNELQFKNDHVVTENNY